MREVIASNDPAANTEQKVQAYMAQLKKTAEGLKVKPNAAGDYELPAENNIFLEKLKAENGVIEGMKILTEFGRDLPGWAAPLLAEYKQGSISAPRNELLIAVMNAELAETVVQLSK